MMRPRSAIRRAVLGVAALGALLVGVLAVAESAGVAPQRGRSRGWANTGPAPDVDYENTPYDGRFTFARVRFNPTSWSGGRYAWGLDLKWNHDYPRADRRLAEIIGAVTGVEAQQQRSGRSNAAAQAKAVASRRGSSNSSKQSSNRATEQ